MIVVWECQLSPKNRQETLRQLDLTLSRIVLKSNAPKRKPYAPAEETLPMAAESATPYGSTGEDEKQP